MSEEEDRLRNALEEETCRLRRELCEAQCEVLRRIVRRLAADKLSNVWYRWKSLSIADGTCRLSRALAAALALGLASCRVREVWQRWSHLVQEALATQHAALIRPPHLTRVAAREVDSLWLGTAGSSDAHGASVRVRQDLRGVAQLARIPG